MNSEFYTRLDNLYAQDAAQVHGFLLRELNQAQDQRDRSGLIAVHNELGSYYRGVGRYRDSADEFEATMELLEEIGMQKTRPWFTALLNRAGTYRMMKRYEEAARDFQRVWTTLSLKLDPDDSDRYIRASALNNLGLTYQDMGRLDLARECVEDGLKQMEQMSASEAEVASGQHNLASICLAQGDLGEAERWLEKAMRYYESKVAFGDSHRANAWNTLGTLRTRQERHEEALTAYDHAAEAMEKFFGPCLNLASICFQAAISSRALGRPDAVERMERARFLFVKFGDDRAETADAILKGWEEMPL